MSHDPEFDPVASKGGSGCGGLILHVLISGAIFVLLVALLLPFVRSSNGPAARRAMCTNNMKQIMIALLNYEQMYRTFPPPYTTDAAGRRLHSWRTLILPFIEENALYKKIDLTRAWDDPANASALRSMPSVYRCPAVTDGENTTCYLALVGTDYAFSPDHPRKVTAFADGTSNTLMIMEAAPGSAVPWMAPRDADLATMLSIRKDTPSNHDGGINVAFADGSVRFMKSSTDLRERLIRLTIRGGEQVSQDRF